MAVKYYSEFSQLDSRTNISAVIRVELSNDDYTGEPIELIGGADPLRIDYAHTEKLQPIRGSRAVMQFLVKQPNPDVNYNLLPNSNDFAGTMTNGYQGGSVTFTENVSVPEWGATDATRVQTSGGTSQIKTWRLISPQAEVAQEMSLSVWAKNTGSNTARIHSNRYPADSSTPVILEPGEQRRVKWERFTPNEVGNIQIQIRARSGHESDALDITLWHAKYEKGPKVTPWTSLMENFTAQEFYTDDEQHWKVNILRDGQSIWRGFVIPDGCSEPFMDPPYTVTIQAVDGLALLKDHDYTERGRVSVLKTIANCLSPISLNMNINAYTSLEYEGQDAGTDTFDEVKIYGEQFSGAGEKEAMTRYDALRSILSSWGAIIQQRHGEWVVCRVADILNIDSYNFYRYNYLGQYIDRNEINVRLTLGNTNETDIRHVNADQLRRNDFPYKEVKVRYNYGFLSNMLPYPAQRFHRGLLPGDFQYWEKQNGINAEPREDDNDPYAVIYGKHTNDPHLMLMPSERPTVGPDQSFRLEINFNVSEADGLPVAIAFIDSGNNFYYLGPDGFSLTYNYRYFLNHREVDGPGSGDHSIGKGEDALGVWDFTTRSDLGTGKLTIMIFPAYFFSGNISNESGEARLYNISLTPVPGGRATIGQRATVVNAGNYTTKPDEIEIYHGESNFSGYVGTMFKADDTPTDGFYRGPATPKQPFIQIMAEDLIYMYGRPMTIYTGSVYGYFDYLGIIEITNGLDGKFLPVSADYDMANNITRVELIEVSDTPITLSENTVEEIPTDSVNVNISDV